LEIAQSLGPLCSRLDPADEIRQLAGFGFAALGMLLAIVVVLPAFVSEQFPERGWASLMVALRY
jgi:hypothetical protein